MDRNRFFTSNGKSTTVSFVKLDEKDTDTFISFREGVDRMDRLSDQYFGDPTYGFLIMLANPQYGGLEFNIPDGSIIRIPLPFEQTKTEYENKQQNNK